MLRATVILFFLPTLVFGQMLVNPKGEVLEDKPFFNIDFIQKNNSKRISGTYSTKFDRDIIRPSNNKYVYEFDRLGQLVRKYKLHSNDTLIATFLYDYKGNISMHRESNKFGFYEKRFKYDDRDRVIQMELRRDKNSSLNKLSFELDISTVVATERFEYIPLEGIDYKKVCYNSADRIYRIEFYYFNSDGFLAKKESALHNGTGRSEVIYFYNEKGQVEEVKTISKQSGTHTSKKIFEYDEYGNLFSRFVYRNDKLMTEEQLVYFEDNQKLKAIISREKATSMMTILKFTAYTVF